MQSNVSELSQCVDAWPSDRHFSVDEVLAEHPEFRNDSLAIEQLVLEEYVRRLEAGERLNPSTFCQRFSTVSPSLTRQLRNLAELHSRHCLLATDDAMGWAFPVPGDELNGYTLTEEIGRGAFSRVFLAKDGHVANREVVVKTTYHGCAEIELLGPMSHPHLPRIFYCGRDPETNITTICMDWIGQRSLNDLIAEIHLPEPGKGVSARRAVTKALTVVRQVADGLACAHAHNVLHLDVKPSNILLRDDGTAVLIDFNLAIAASQSRDMGFRGTLAYAAPEVIATAVQGVDAPSPVTEAADVFSLATVLYELLTGDLPFPDVPSGAVEEAARAALHAKQKPVPRPSKLNPEVDPELDKIIQRALAARPEDRFPTAQQFYDALRAYSLPARRTSPQRPIILALTVSVVLLTVFFSGSRGTTPDLPRPAARAETINALARNTPPGGANALPSTLGVEEALIAGWNHLLNNDPGAAQRVFEGAGQSSDDPRLEASKAYALMMHQKFGEARLQLFKIMREPNMIRDDTGVVVGYAYSCLRACEQLSGAARTLDGLLAVHPDHELALFLHALIDIQIEKMEKEKLSHRTGGVDLVDRLNNLNTNSSSALVQAVTAYRSFEDPGIIDEHLALTVETTIWPEAAASSGLVISLLPDFVDLHLLKQHRR